jgi:hypothetical protein
VRVRARVSLEEAPPLARVAILSEGRVHGETLPRLRALLHPHQVTAAEACGRQRCDTEVAARADDAAIVGVRLDGEHSAQQQPVEDTLVVREGVGERQSAQRPLARELDRAGVRPEPDHPW